MFALVLVSLLLLGGLTALSGARLDPADFTFANATEPESLDPKVVSGVPEGRVLRTILEGLTNLDPKTLAPIPGMAESWKISKDRRTYTFRIRKDAKWSDGSPLTAFDFLYSWKRFLDPENPATYVSFLYYVENAKAYVNGDIEDFEKVGLKAQDRQTFVVKLAYPTPYFLQIAAFYPLFPVHRKTVERFPRDWHHPRNLVTNGPFKIQIRSIRDRIRCVKNPHYWDAENVKLNTLDILAVEDQNTRLNLYLTGVVDWIDDVPNHVIPALKKRADFRNTTYLGIYFYRVNTKHKDPVKRRFLGDPRVRLALYLAMDRAAICERVTKAGEEPARSLCPVKLEDYSSYQVPMLPDRDVERAKKLLGEALEDLGLDEAPSLTILYNTNETHKQIAEVLQDTWARTLGLRIRLDNQEWQTYLSSQENLTYDLCRAGWIGDYNDPNTFLDLLLSDNTNNRTGYASKDYDDLIHAAEREPDPEQRLRILEKAEKLLLTDLPVLPIYYYVTKNMVRPWVKGFHDNLQNVHPMKFFSIDAGMKARTPVN
ncbi:MAG: peptide ABC transporter substrate-binding protein [Planctomycetota bacterium]